MEPRAKKSQSDDDSFCAEHSQVEANVEDEGDSWGVCSQSAEAEDEITPLRRLKEELPTHFSDGAATALETYLAKAGYSRNLPSTAKQNDAAYAT